MKSLILFTLTTVFASISSASAPTVSCEMMYNKNNDQGVSIDFRRGQSIIATNDGATTSNGGFKLNAKIEQLCAVFAAGIDSDSNPPCYDEYNFTANVSRGDVSSEMLKVISLDDNGDRHSLSMKVGNESVVVNCDISE